MRFLILSCIFLVVATAGAAFFMAENSRAEGVIATKPVYVPNMSREAQHLPDTVIVWDATMKTTNVPANSDEAHFIFYFTNVAMQVDATLTTNITTKTYAVTTPTPILPSARSISPATRVEFETNVVWVTNSITPIPVTVLDVHPSCGCTTAQLPPLPWTLPPGTNSEIGVTVNLAGKFGTVVKTVHIGTDQGSRDLIVQITIMPEKVTEPTEAERAHQMLMAKADRQAIFKNDCVSCHVKPGQYKFGKALYDADCGICHEAEHRASMVPDLHTLKVPTNDDFWRAWIAHGKPGTFMPAFSNADGGPLSDIQIASLAAYLNATIPSHVPSPQ
jgi:cytochrome c553